MSAALRSLATASALLAALAQPVFAQPRAAFPPPPPSVSAQPHAVSSPEPHATAAQPAAPSARTQAQPPPTYVPPRPLYYPPRARSLSLVGFRNDVPHMRFVVEFDQNGRVLGGCTDGCWVYLWPGRYRVQVARSKHVLPGSRPFSVHGPALVTISPRRHRNRAWLGVGIASTVLVLGTPPLFGVYVANHPLREEAPLSDLAVPMLLIFGFLASAVMTPISFIEYERSSRPGLTVEPLVR